MKILAIGNSFSEDATAYLKKISDSAGVELKVVNLYIGGCSLKTHAKNIKENAPEYRYELNGVYTERMASIEEVLKEEDWDVVTIQQFSGEAGVPESYGEFAKTVISCIKENAQQAKIYFHQTWSYEIDSTHPYFKTFDCNQELMDDKIKQTVKDFCSQNGNISIIPCGEVISKIRRTKEFNYKDGGQTLCRDGFHMHLIYGRYATAATWFEALTGVDIHMADFVPTNEDIVNGYEKLQNFSTDIEKINIIKGCVHSLLTEMR